MLIISNAFWPGKTYSATFGSAPKARDARSESPGPGAYVQNFSVRGRGRRAVGKCPNSMEALMILVVVNSSYTIIDFTNIQQSIIYSGILYNNPRIMFVLMYIYNIVCINICIYTIIYYIYMCVIYIYILYIYMRFEK